jgi:hypothetical protein
VASAAAHRSRVSSCEPALLRERWRIRTRLGQAAAACATLEDVLKVRTASLDAKSGEIEEAVLALAELPGRIG